MSYQNNRRPPQAHNRHPAPQNSNIRSTPQNYSSRPAPQAARKKSSNAFEDFLSTYLGDNAFMKFIIGAVALVLVICVFAFCHAGRKEANPRKLAVQISNMVEDHEIDKIYDLTGYSSSALITPEAMQNYIIKSTNGAVNNPDITSYPSELDAEHINNLNIKNPENNRVFQINVEVNNNLESFYVIFKKSNEKRMLFFPKYKAYFCGGGVSDYYLEAQKFYSITVNGVDLKTLPHYETNEGKIKYELDGLIPTVYKVSAASPYTKPYNKEVDLSNKKIFSTDEAGRRSFTSLYTVPVNYDTKLGFECNRIFLSVYYNIFEGKGPNNIDISKLNPADGFSIVDFYNETKKTTMRKGEIFPGGIHNPQIDDNGNMIIQVVNSYMNVQKKTGQYRNVDFTFTLKDGKWELVSIKQVSQSMWDEEMRSSYFRG